MSMHLARSLLVVVAGARGAIADPLTLAQAQAEARQRAPERAVADAAVGAAETRAAVAGRRIAHDPILVGRYQQPAPGQDVDDRAWSVGLEWTLDVSGAWRSRRDRGRATVVVAGSDRATALFDLDADVARAFAELADAQRRVARSERIVALRELAARAAERTRTTGQGNQLDLDAATLDLRGAQVDAVNARGDRDAARIRLARWLGRTDPGELVAADELDVTAAPPNEAIEKLVDRDPRVRGAVAELEAAQRGADAERKAALPEITIGVESGRTRHDVPPNAFATMPALTGAWNEWELAVSLSVPLPIVDRNRVARANANADVLAARAHLALVRADVRASVAEARARLAAALDAVDAAKDIPQIVDREVELLDKALRAGGIDLPAFALQAHRLVELGRVYDDAVLALRRARAAWARYGTP